VWNNLHMTCMCCSAAPTTTLLPQLSVLCRACTYAGQGKKTQCALKTQGCKYTKFVNSLLVKVSQATIQRLGSALEHLSKLRSTCMPSQNTRV
jgi:hypothetical protein